MGYQGTGVDRIGFSVADLDSKMAELESVGVRGSGVRLVRFDDGALVREILGSIKPLSSLTLGDQNRISSR